MILLILFIIFLFMLVFSAPIALNMGAASLIAVLVEGKISPLIIVSKLFSGMDSLPFLAVPFFMFSGQLMDAGGLSKRLVNFSKVLVGHMRGGLGMVSVVASMIFAGISGSSAADTTAVGSILIPAMIKNGYKKGFVASLQACAGTIGPIIPPSILMIIYGSITELSIGKLFLSGIIPGIIIGFFLMGACYIYAVKAGFAPTNRGTFKELLVSFREAIWALIMPIIVIGGILFGVVTATEAGMIAVLYGLFVGIVVYKEIKVKDLPKLLIKAGKVSASILLIAGFANGFAWLLAKNLFPTLTVNFLISLTSSPALMIFIIITFFLILGCFIETLAAVIIFVPVIQGIVVMYGYDPIHFALIIIITLLIGQVTPPVGILLFLTTQMAKIKIKETMKYIWPLVGVMVIALLVIAYIPDLAMFIPRLLMK